MINSEHRTPARFVDLDHRQIDRLRQFCGWLHRLDEASVDEVVGSGDVRGAVAGEEDDEVAHFLGSGESSSRGVTHGGLRDVVRGSSRRTGHGGGYTGVTEPEGSADRAGSNCVHADAAPSDL